MEIRAGTSGFGYREWIGNFYPAGTRPEQMLRSYAGRLPAVEIDNTFYRLPRAGVLESWADQVPRDFRFAIKASRRITHAKRLKGAEDETDYLLRTCAVLGERLGAVLFQLPPNLPKDLDRLERFLDLARGRARIAMEFRHPSWFTEDVFRAMRTCDAALCLVDTDDAPEPSLIPTASFGYMRLRRRNYGNREVESWVDRVKAQPWTESFVFFKHEDAGVGPKLAGAFLASAAGVRT